MKARIIPVSYVWKLKEELKILIKLGYVGLFRRVESNFLFVTVSNIKSKKKKCCGKNFFTEISLVLLRELTKFFL